MSKDLMKVAILALVVVMIVLARLASIASRQQPNGEGPANEAGWWFPRKTYGWGWGPPARWQGWVTLSVFLVLMFVGLPAALMTFGAPAAVLVGAVLSAALLIVVWAKGEPSRTKPR